MLTTGDPEGVRAHDAYHRFVRAGRWDIPVCQGELRPAVHSKFRPHRARFGLIPDEFFNPYTRTPR